MLSKSLISILALTSAVSASPALRRQADPCQDAYKACIAAGTPEVACSCTLTACVGEDNARNREYCASATANLKKSATTAAPSVCPTALFDGCNPARSACPDGPGTYTTVSPSTYPTSYVINGQTVSLTAAPTSCLPTAASSASASATSSAAAASGCVAKYNTCRTTRVNGLSANQAQCAADNAACQGDCYAKYNTCRTTRVNGLSANMAQCASEYAGCLGENPIASTGGLISSFIPYSATASSSAAAKTTPATTLTTTAAAAPKASGTNAAAPGSNPKKVDGKTWKLNNVIRYCGEGNTGCDYNFDIVANGNTQHCTVIRMPGSNAASESWSNQKCGDYTVSWGYVANPAPAYAVLTVVDKAGQLAWFGASNINGQAVTPSNPFGSGNYGNLGPEQVYTYN